MGRYNVQYMSLGSRFLIALFKSSVPTNLYLCAWSVNYWERQIKTFLYNSSLPGFPFISANTLMSEAVLLCLCVCLIAQLCPTLCDLMICNPPGSSVHGDPPGKNAGVGCHPFFQGIFPTQGSNSGLPHCRRILYHWATKEALKQLENYKY